jgi:hypothetical protein
MGRKTPAIVVAAAIFVLALCAGSYKYHADVEAWEQVQNSVVRLQSGIQFESVIALRSHLADADAAVKLYQSRWRAYPPGGRERARDAEQSLDYISSALDWQTRSGDDQESVRTLGKYPEITTSIRRSCLAGRIFISSSDVSAAFVVAAKELLGHSEYPATSKSDLSLTRQFAPLDFGKESAECERQKAAREENERQQAVARKESEERKYWVQFRYRVSLKLVPSAAGTCVFDVKTDGKFVDSIELYPSRTREFGANHKVEMLAAQCYGGTPPTDVIRISVNGKPYAPKWAGEYALIVPD